MPFQFPSYFCHNRQSHGLNYTCAGSKNAISCALKTTIYISSSRVGHHLLVPELLVPHFHVYKLLADTFVATLSSPQRSLNCVATTNYSPPPTTVQHEYRMLENILPPTLMDQMAQSAGSASIWMLLACLGLIAAVQYPLLLSSLLSIIYPTSSSIPSPEVFGDGIADLIGTDNVNCSERKDILKQMSATPGWERLESHPRRRLLAAMVGLLEYSDRAQAGVQEKRRGWWKLTNRQREVRILVLPCIVAIHLIL